MANYNSRRSHRRIFLIHANDTDKKTCSGKIKANDVLLVLTQDPHFQIPDYLSENRPFVCTVGADSELFEIQQIIEERLYAEDTVYFIGPIMSEYFDTLKPVLLDKCAGIAKHTSFGVRNVEIVRSTDVQTSMFDDAESTADLLGSFLGADLLSDETAGRSDCSAKDTRKKESADNKKKQIDKKDVPDMNSGKQGSQESDESKKMLSCIQQAKAELVAAFRQRLHQHITRNINAEMSTDKTYRFITLLLKSDSIKDFIQSWFITENESLSALSESRFLKLKAEATYYFNFCNMIYMEDVFGDDAEE